MNGPERTRAMYDRLRVEYTRYYRKLRAQQMAAIAAELEDDKQVWAAFVGEDGRPTGESILVRGTKPTKESPTITATPEVD